MLRFGTTHRPICRILVSKQNESVMKIKEFVDLSTRLYN